MRIERGDFRREVLPSGEDVVFAGGQQLHLSPVAQIILDAVPEASTATLEDVAAALVAELGHPSDDDLNGMSATSHQVRHLIAYGVLREAGGSASATTTLETSTEALSDLRMALTMALNSQAGTPTIATPEEFLAAARRHRVAALLDRFVPEGSLPDMTHAHLTAAGAANLLQMESVERDLPRALAVLKDAGVRALSFKGQALSQMAYGDHRVRGYGDLDLLVSPSDTARAHAALSEAGWSPHTQFPAPTAGWGWGHLIASVHEMPFYGNQTSIDLHWHLLAARSTFPNFDALWDRRAQATTGVSELPTLGRFDALAHSCSHAAKDGWRTLRALADIHALASQRETWLDATRPLRRDQLISLGLSATLFGAPRSSPQVVEDAVRLAEPFVDAMTTAQLRSESHVHSTQPGTTVLALLRSWRLTQGSAGDLWRHGRAALIPTSSAVEPGTTWIEALTTTTSERIRVLTRGSR